jgi:replication fork protection complex subunit Tof1/Swi1
MQKKRKPRARLTRRSSNSPSDDEAGPRRQRKKKVAEVQNYKSAAFIDVSSDEDEEADKAFFEKEKRLREDMMRIAEERAGQVLREMQAAAKTGKKDKGKGKGKGRAIEEEVNQANGASEEEPDSDAERSRSESDADSEEEELRTSKRSKQPRSRAVVDSDEDGDTVDGGSRRSGGLSDALITSDSE